MKLKKEFIVHDVLGETMIVAVGRRASAYPGIITCNETAGRIAHLLKSPTTEEAITAAMLEEYDAEPGQLREDVAKTLRAFSQAGILEE